MTSLELQDALASIADRMVARSKETIFPIRQGMSWVAIQKQRESAASILGREVRRLTGGKLTVYLWRERPILGSNIPLLAVVMAAPDARRQSARGIDWRAGDIGYKLYLIGSGSLRLVRTDE